MVNAWSLLYEELNGTMNDTYPIKTEGKMTDKNRVTPQESDEYDPITTESSGTFNVPEGTLGLNDTITFTSDGVGAAEEIKIDTSGHDVITFGDGSDTLNFGTPFPGGMGEDHISFAGTQYDDPSYYASAVDFNLGSMGSGTKPQPDLTRDHKYGEDKGIKDLKDYVASTYSGHYTNKGSNVQTLDLIQSVGDAESFCRSNAIKYLSRYDKRGQAKRDILKAMHYCLLLYYFSGNTQEDLTQHGYETF